jgi:hypothetical protein
MIGSAADMIARLLALLPLRWFGDTTPVLSALLAGLADGWAWLYTMLMYAQAQTRIATATDTFLDLISQDFFDTALPRRFGETDDAFRLRIQQNMLRPRATRAALAGELTNLTGRAPRVFEPARPADTGGWGVAVGYDVAGGYGSLLLPFQVFVTAYRPLGTGVPLVGGWGHGHTAYGAGGWGMGAIEYVSLAMVQSQVRDADIDQAIASTVPVAVTAWTRISN